MSPAQLLSRYLGEAEQRVRSLFARARARAPSLILLDGLEHIGAAREALDDGELEFAADVLTRALAAATAPTDRKVRLTIALKLSCCDVHLGRFEAAEAHCTAALELERFNFEALHRRGQARRVLGKTSLARIDLMLALEQLPTDATSAAERGEAQRLRTLVDEELERLRTPAERSPRKPWDDDTRLPEVDDVRLRRALQHPLAAEEERHRRADAVHRALGARETVVVRPRGSGQLERRSRGEPFPVDRSIQHFLDSA